MSGAERLEMCKAAVVEAGYTVSCGCFHDEERDVTYAFSVEMSGRSMYAAPKFTAQIGHGWYSRTGLKAERIQA